MNRLRLNGITVSIILGFIVIIIVGVLLVNYFNTPFETSSDKEYCTEYYSNSTMTNTPNKCLKYFGEGGEYCGK